MLYFSLIGELLIIDIPSRTKIVSILVLEIISHVHIHSPGENYAIIYRISSNSSRLRIVVDCE